MKFNFSVFMQPWTHMDKEKLYREICLCLIRPHIVARKLTRGDSDIMKDLAALHDRVFLCRRHNRISELQEIAAAPETGAVFIALHGSMISGFVHVRYARRIHEWVVRGIGMDRPYRRTGIGCMLLETAAGFVNDNVHAGKLVSYVDRGNIPSLRLHEKAGFIIDSGFPFGKSELRYRLVYRGTEVREA